jgi:hypothetical protein
MSLVKAWAKGILPPSRARNIRTIDFRGGLYLSFAIHPKAKALGFLDIHFYKEKACEN